MSKHTVGDTVRVIGYYGNWKIIDACITMAQQFFIVRQDNRMAVVKEKELCNDC